MIQRRLIPTYIFLAIVSLVSVFPFYWMIMAATNDYVDISRGKLTFGTAALENFRNLIDQQPLALAMKNSFVYAISVTIICLLICSLAGYLDVQLGKIQRFARNRVHGIGCQFDDLVLVP